VTRIGDFKVSKQGLREGIEHDLLHDYCGDVDNPKPFERPASVAALIGRTTWTVAAYIEGNLSQAEFEATKDTGAERDDVKNQKATLMGAIPVGDIVKLPEDIRMKIARQPDTLRSLSKSVQAMLQEDIINQYENDAPARRR